MNTGQVFDALRAYESRNVTHLEADGSWPIVWERARGAYVWDAEGKKYLDLTGAFGVAAAGHANARVVKAGQKQMAKLLHAMGDVHPHALKAQLARELSRLTFERWGGKSKVQSLKSKVLPGGPRDEGRGARGERRSSGGALPTLDTRHPSLSGKTIFCNSGVEAVEAA